MKALTYIILIAAVISFILSVVTKTANLMIGGVGPTGYLNGTMILLLFSANLALLDLLNKK